MRKNNKASFHLPSLFKAVGFVSKLAWEANAIAVIGLGVVQVMGSLIPLASAFIAGAILTEITRAVTTHNMMPILVYFGIGFILTTLRSFSSGVSNYFSLRLRYDVENKATQALMEKYAKLSLTQREDRKVADLFEQAESFASRADWIFERGVGIISNSLLLVGAMIALSVVNIWLGIVITIALIPSFILQVSTNRKERFFWKSNSIGRRFAWEYRNNILDLNRLSELRLGGLTDFFVNRWRNNFTQDQKERIQLEKKTLPYNFLAAVSENIATVGALVWAALQITAGKLPVGYFITLQQLVSSAQGAITSMMWMIASAMQDILNTNDFYQFLQLPEEEHGTTVVSSDSIPSIEFRNVSFIYPQAEHPALANVNLVISPRDSIALVGENGSGKTTLIKLLLGLYKPTSGEILVNGINLAKINKESWYRNVGVLFQDFSRYGFMDLGDNIWVGDITKKYHSTAFDSVLRDSDLSTLPKKLKKGYRQLLSKSYEETEGTDLSGGQWQRVALARSFFRSANILILDEPTAAVDARAEYEIFQNIAKNQADKTTIIISHRFSTVRKAKKIFVLENGRITEEGSHVELMKQAGKYKKLFDLQAEGYK